jgi:hypothetical protein
MRALAPSHASHLICGGRTAGAGQLGHLQSKSKFDARQTDLGVLLELLVLGQVEQAELVLVDCGGGVTTSVRRRRFLQV